MAHHGVKGQRWGVRRYQNEDGTLTKEGEAHYKTAKAYKEASEQNAKDAGDKSLGLFSRTVSARAVVPYSRKADELVKQAGFKSLDDMTKAYKKTKKIEWEKQNKLLQVPIDDVLKRRAKGQKYDKNGASYYRNGKPVAIIGFD